MGTWWSYYTTHWYFVVIRSNCVVNLSPDKKAVLQEAYRVLKVRNLPNRLQPRQRSTGSKECSLCSFFFGMRLESRWVGSSTSVISIVVGLFLKLFGRTKFCGVCWATHCSNEEIDGLWHISIKEDMGNSSVLVYNLLGNHFSAL